MTPGPGFKPRTHWWKASALTTAPSLLTKWKSITAEIAVSSSVVDGGEGGWGEGGRYVALKNALYVFVHFFALTVQCYLLSLEFANV